MGLCVKVQSVHYWGFVMIADDNRVWYHVVLSTYGSWLYGDKRGFRTRHHREHVDGDYKNPPSLGKYGSQ